MTRPSKRAIPGALPTDVASVAAETLSPPTGTVTAAARESSKQVRCEPILIVLKRGRRQKGADSEVRTQKDQRQAASRHDSDD